MFRGADGRIWLSTPAGLAVVAPRRVPASRVPPPVHVEEVVVDGRTLARGDLFQIPANPERLTIHYTAASPRMPERVRVQYRLDGVDAAWQEGSAPRVATYTQLRPGRYRFRVRAWNEDGVPRAGAATLAMRVLPAWYQTPWAAALGLAGVAGIGAAGASGVARVRRRRAEAAEQATIAERVRVARELHDTILSDLAGLAMRLDAAAVNAGRVASPAGPDLIVLPELRDHARRTLDETRRAVTAMRVSTVMVPLWAQLAEVARRVCDGASVATSFRYVGRPRRYAPELEAEALRITGEALANACRHSGGREVAVTCTYGRAALVVSVRDDGCGFDPARDGAAAAEAGHWGLLGMRERALALGGTLDIDSAPGRGTTVRLRLPARQAARRG
jgi:signal transduction histidine kinase